MRQKVKPKGPEQVSICDELGVKMCCCSQLLVILVILSNFPLSVSLAIFHLKVE